MCVPFTARHLSKESCLLLGGGYHTVSRGRERMFYSLKQMGVSLLKVSSQLWSLLSKRNVGTELEVGPMLPTLAEATQTHRTTFSLCFRYKKPELSHFQLAISTTDRQSDASDRTCTNFRQDSLWLWDLCFPFFTEFWTRSYSRSLLTPTALEASMIFVSFSKHQRLQL